MKQTNFLKSLFLLFALIVGSVSVWGADVTFTAGTDQGSNGSSGSGDTMTKNGITISGSNLATTTTQYRIYSGCTLTISSSVGNITQIVITSTANKGSNYGPDKISLKSGSTGTYTTTSGSKDGTWTGSASSVSFSASAQCRASKIVVTYTPAGISHNLSSAVTPTGVGTVSLGSTTVVENSNTTIEATVTNQNYRFKNWTYTGTGASVANVNAASTTFTMGTSDATVTANFEAIPTHTLNIVVSPVGAGTITLGSSIVAEGLTTTATAASNLGYKFTGWSIAGTGATLSSTSANPTTVTMGTTNATITANFVEDPNIYVTIDEDDIENSTNTKTGYGEEKVITKDGYTWLHNGYQTNTDYRMIQIRQRTHDNGVSWIKLPTFPGTIQKIEFVVTGAGASNRTGVTTTNALYFQAGNTKSEAIIKTSNNDASNSRTLDLTSVATKYNTGYITANGSIRIWEVTVAYLPATVTSAGWGTYVAPCAVEFEEGDAYVVSSATENTTLKEVVSVPAGTPVLLRGEGPKNISVVASAEVPTSNLLKVSDGTVVGDDATIYVLANKANGVGFYLWDSTADPIPSGKVYLDTTGIGAKSLEYFSLDNSIFDESETDGIKAVSTSVENGVRYNLAGQRVGKDYKGIVIVNGKKMLNK